MDKRIKLYLILLAIYLLLKTDLPISVPYLFETQGSPQIYDLLSAYFTNRSLGCYAMEYVSLKRTSTAVQQQCRTDATNQWYGLDHGIRLLLMGSTYPMQY